MSLRINTDNVERVLLADGWHTVFEKSFDLDAYAYVSPDGAVLHGGSQSGITGFSFYSETASGYKGPVTKGPLTAIIAVQGAKL